MNESLQILRDLGNLIKSDFQNWQAQCGGYETELSDDPIKDLYTDIKRFRSLLYSSWSTPVDAAIPMGQAEDSYAETPAMPPGEPIHFSEKKSPEPTPVFRGRTGNLSELSSALNRSTQHSIPKSSDLPGVERDDNQTVPPEDRKHTGFSSVSKASQPVPVPRSLLLGESQDHRAHEQVPRGEPEELAYRSKHRERFDLVSENGQISGESEDHRAHEQVPRVEPKELAYPSKKQERFDPVSENGQISGHSSSSGKGLNDFTASPKSRTGSLSDLSTLINRPSESDRPVTPEKTGNMPPGTETEPTDVNRRTGSPSIAGPRPDAQSRLRSESGQILNEAPGREPIQNELISKTSFRSPVSFPEVVGKEPDNTGAISTNDSGRSDASSTVSRQSQTRLSSNGVRNHPDLGNSSTEEMTHQSSSTVLQPPKTEEIDHDNPRMEAREYHRRPKPTPVTDRQTSLPGMEDGQTPDRAKPKTPWIRPEAPPAEDRPARSPSRPSTEVTKDIRDDEKTESIEDRNRYQSFPTANRLPERHLFPTADRLPERHLFPSADRLPEHHPRPIESQGQAETSKQDRLEPERRPLDDAEPIPDVSSAGQKRTLNRDLRDLGEHIINTYGSNPVFGRKRTDTPESGKKEEPSVGPVVDDSLFSTARHSGDKNNRPSLTHPSGAVGRGDDTSLKKQVEPVDVDSLMETLTNEIKKEYRRFYGDS